MSDPLTENYAKNISESCLNKKAKKALNKIRELTDLLNESIKNGDNAAFRAYIIEKVGKEEVKNTDINKLIQTLINDFLNAANEREPYKMPTSNKSHFLKEFLQYGRNIEDLPPREERKKHGVKVDIIDNWNNKKMTAITRTTKKEKTSIILKSFDLLQKHNKTSDKFFDFILCKAAEQLPLSRQLNENQHITFTLDEVLEAGLYTDLDAARDAFRAAGHVLTSIKMEWGKRRLEVLFTGAEIKNGICYVFFNDRLDWCDFARFYMALPHYYFELTNKARCLLYNVCYLARQRKRQNAFKIKMLTVQQALNLPPATGNHDPKRTILTPLENAINEIKERDENVKITIEGERESVSKLLLEGSLVVEIPVF